MKQRLFLAFLTLTLMSCQLFTPQPTPIPTPPKLPDRLPEGSQPTARPTQQTLPASTPTPLVEANPHLSSFSVDTSRPFYDLPLARWEPKPYPGRLDTLPVKLASLTNPAVISGLSADQRAGLAKNGFLVLPTQEQQFAGIRLEVADQSGQPYYLTTDAAFHALHINFDELLKNLERAQFRPQMIVLIQALLKQTQTYRQSAEGTLLEADAQLAAAYLAVALKLFDPQFTAPRDLAAQVNGQVKQILAAAGREQSSLLPDFEDDYSAYQPVGHYATHPDLETYFRAMTWLGRVAFTFKDPEQPQRQPSRAPLIITLALRETSAGQLQPAAVWGQIHETLTFLIGPSDDPGPVELSTLMDAVYGPALSIERLADESLWQSFLQRIDELPAPQINSTFVSSTQVLQASRDWRLMGQRFTLDGLILQNMVFDKVGTREKPRKLPSGLDVMAAFGSPAALTALQQAGEPDYANYQTQLEKMQNAVQAQPESEWLNRFASGWLYAFLPQVGIKNEGYPPYMRSPAWSDKELNSALGSWAELKHDTVLYTKMPEFMGGGGPPSSGPAPAFVEPNPDVFYRLAYLAQNMAEGLRLRGLANSPERDLNQPDFPLPLDRLVAELAALGERFSQLGDIAARELQRQTPNEAECELITACLGIIECDESLLPEQPPVPVVAAVAGAENQVLEVAVGGVDRIYVVVPIDGSLQVAQGGVFSYYEFSQPRSARLSDEAWRQRLAVNPPARPAWTDSFVLPGGGTRAALVFRLNDVYIITPKGGSPPLNVRAEPSTTASVKSTLAVGTYIRIMEGPVQSSGNTWWQIQEENGPAAGWVAENPTWYERAYGQ